MTQYLASTNFSYSLFSNICWLKDTSGGFRLYIFVSFVPCAL